MKFNIIKEDDIVSICVDCDNSLDSFIDIYVDDTDIKSPFKDIGDAEFFAKWIVKMLKVMTDDIKR